MYASLGRPVQEEPQEHSSECTTCFAEQTPKEPDRQEMAQDTQSPRRHQPRSQMETNFEMYPKVSVDHQVESQALARHPEILDVGRRLHAFA